MSSILKAGVMMGALFGVSAILTGPAQAGTGIEGPRVTVCNENERGFLCSDVQVSQFGDVASWPELRSELPKSGKYIFTCVRHLVVNGVAVDGVTSEWLQGADDDGEGDSIFIRVATCFRQDSEFSGESEIKFLHETDESTRKLVLKLERFVRANSNGTVNSSALDGAGVKSTVPSEGNDSPKSSQNPRGTGGSLAQ